MNRPITLITDFGLKDPYQGAMKGAMLSVNPEARIFDVSHLVAPGNIVEGAFIMLEACPFYPSGTIHLGVVDPGVGGERRPILIETARNFFIGPDNGLLSLVAGAVGIKRIIELTERAYFLKDVSNTFHGRDIFGPVAAHLSLGVDPARFGPEIEGITALELPATRGGGGVVEGEVIYADSFGNLITNIRREALSGLAPGIEVRIKGERIKGLTHTYGSAEKGSLLALFSSSGLLEIAINQGSAAASLKAGVGERVTVILLDMLR